MRHPAAPEQVSEAIIRPSIEPADEPSDSTVTFAVRIAVLPGGVTNVPLVVLLRPAQMILAGIVENR